MRRPSMMTRTTFGFVAACAVFAISGMVAPTCHAQIAFDVDLEVEPPPFTDGFAYWYGTGQGDRGQYRIEMRVDFDKKVIEPGVGIVLTDVKFVVRRGNRGRIIFSQNNLDGLVLPGPPGPGKTFTLTDPNTGCDVVVGNVVSGYMGPTPALSGPREVTGQIFVSESGPRFSWSWLIRLIRQIFGGTFWNWY